MEYTAFYEQHVNVDNVLDNTQQLQLFALRPPKQLLKWIGNKQRYASQIADFIPDYNTYVEPFLGSGAVLGTMAPASGIAGDILEPLVNIWQQLQTNSQALLNHYADIWQHYIEDRPTIYKQVLAAYNASPNPYDLLFLCRACYGGVVRFTKDGRMSTPVGAHTAISPESLKERIEAWRERIRTTTFIHADFEQTMAYAKKGDIVYCDPPYEYTQKNLYGAQDFSLSRLWQAVEECKMRDAKVMLSLDGKKKSGMVALKFDIPDGLFQREISIDCGGSMLRRFQKRGETMENEGVHDRLLLTW
ncbi:MAG: hypothetical protein NVS9B9_30280 [Ktedonobacteraceae bacterium]